MCEHIINQISLSNGALPQSGFLDNFLPNLLATFIGSLLALIIALYIYTKTKKDEKDRIYKENMQKEVQFLIALNDYIVPNLELLDEIVSIVSKKDPLKNYYFDTSTFDTLVSLSISNTKRIEIRRLLLHGIFQLNNLNSAMGKFKSVPYDGNDIINRCKKTKLVLVSLKEKNDKAIEELKDYIEIIIS